MYTLIVGTHFDAAHYIRDYEGKCSREHGHRWEVEVAFEGERLDSRNILVDFTEVKAALKGIIEAYLDHYQLNEALDEPNVTAEYLAKWLYQHVRAYSLSVTTRSVTVWESPDCGVTFNE